MYLVSSQCIYKACRKIRLTVLTYTHTISNPRDSCLPKCKEVAKLASAVCRYVYVDTDQRTWTSTWVTAFVSKEPSKYFVLRDAYSLRIAQRIQLQVETTDTINMNTVYSFWLWTVAIASLLKYLQPYSVKLLYLQTIYLLDTAVDGVYGEYKKVSTISFWPFLQAKQKSPTSSTTT